MTIWIDAQLSPGIAVWLRQELGVEAVAVRDLGLRDATDQEIFVAARQASAIVMTKDSDFVQLVHGSFVPESTTVESYLRDLLSDGRESPRPFHVPVG